MSWSYQTPVGLFTIRPDNHWHYDLYIDNELLGCYREAEDAAEEVAKRSTGFSLWDDLLDAATPQGLKDWKKS